MVVRLVGVPFWHRPCLHVRKLTGQFRNFHWQQRLKFRDIRIIIQTNSLACRTRWSSVLFNLQSEPFSRCFWLLLLSTSCLLMSIGILRTRMLWLLSDVWPRRLILTRVDGCKMLRNCTQPRMLGRKGGTESSGQHCQAHVEGVQGC